MDSPPLEVRTQQRWEALPPIRSRQALGSATHRATITDYEAFVLVRAGGSTCRVQRQRTFEVIGLLCDQRLPCLGRAARLDAQETGFSAPVVGRWIGSVRPKSSSSGAFDTAVTQHVPQEATARYGRRYRIRSIMKRSASRTNAPLLRGAVQPDARHGNTGNQSFLLPRLCVPFLITLPTM